MSYYIDQLMEEEQKRKLADLLMAGEAGSFPAFMPQPDYSGERGVGNYPAPDYRDARDLGAISTGGGIPQQQTMAQFFAKPQPEQPPQVDRRSAGTTVGSYGNTQSRYVRDPESGEFIPNPDYISSGIENDPSTIRVTGQMMNNAMQQGGATADSMLKNLFAMTQPGYREANPDMAYSSRTHNQGVQNIQDRPEYKQFAAMMALEGPAAKAAKDRADAAQLQAKPQTEQGTWSAVESNGKQYLINNKTGAIKPAEIGGQQLQGKPKTISPMDAKSIDRSTKASESANAALQYLDQADALYSRYESDLMNPIMGPVNRAFSAVIPGQTQAAEDYEVGMQIAKDLGVIKLGLIGGSDTERELQVAIDTSPSPDKTTGANKKISANARKAIQILQLEPDFKTEWVNKNGSLSSLDASGKPYGKAWREFQKESFSGEGAGGKSLVDKIPKEASPANGRYVETRQTAQGLIGKTADGKLELIR